MFQHNLSFTPQPNMKLSQGWILMILFMKVQKMKNTIRISQNRKHPIYYLLITYQCQHLNIYWHLITVVVDLCLIILRKWVYLCTKACLIFPTYSLECPQTEESRAVTRVSLTNFTTFLHFNTKR